jgi:hypothetical protein
MQKLLITLYAKELVNSISRHSFLILSRFDRLHLKRAVLNLHSASVVLFFFDQV